MISVTGWTYDYIDEYMTLPRVNEIAQYFAKQPHVNESTAAILYALTGYSKDEEVIENPTGEQLMELL